MSNDDIKPEMSPLPHEKQNENVEATLHSDLQPSRFFDRSELSHEVTLAEIEQILKSSSSKWQERAAAARALARFGASISIPVLFKALSDKHKRVRVAALEACADLAPHIPVALVNAALLDPQWSVRAAAAWALGHFAAHAPRPRLLALLHDPLEDPLVRASALHALASLGELAPLAAILASLDDPQWHLREVAALSLGHLRVLDATDALVDRLRHDDEPSVRAAAAQALSNMDIFTTEVINVLQMALKDSDEIVSEAAAQALEIVVRRSIEILQDTEQPKSVRQMAANAIHSLRDYVPDNTLVALLGEEELIREALLEALNEPDHINLAPPDSRSVDIALEQQAPTLNVKKEIRKDGNVEFVPLTPSDLTDSPPIIAQALDNQWVPRSLLRLIMNNRLTYADVAPYVEKQVRTEYIRSLINGRNTVMNRAFFYNNPVVYRDFLSPGQGREAFKKLLASGVIRPLLLKEQAPHEPPPYTVSQEGLNAWQQLCQQVRMECVRFTWDSEQAQDEAFWKLSQGFQNRIQTAINNDPKTYVNDFGLPLGVEKALRKRFAALSHEVTDIWMDRERFATREDVYKSFVTVDGTPPSERRYDGAQPFASEIKQYVDLVYNANLADALNGYLLTPNDTLPRTALQEWDSISKKVSASQFNVAEIMQIARKKLFDLVQAGLYLKSMRWLSLEDVLVIRQTEEWAAYVTHLDTLLKGSIVEFAEQAPAIYRQYALLMELITEMLRRRHKSSSQLDFTAAWEPIPSLEIDIGGAKTSISWQEDRSFAIFKGLETPSCAPGGRASFAVRLKIGDLHGSSMRADLFTNIDFMKGRLDAALDQWEKLKKELPEIMSTHERYERTQTFASTITEQEKAMR